MGITRHYSEKTLENALIDKLGHFLLELGKGFAFVGQQYRITLYLGCHGKKTIRKKIQTIVSGR